MKFTTVNAYCNTQYALTLPANTEVEVTRADDYGDRYRIQNDLFIYRVSIIFLYSVFIWGREITPHTGR